MKQIEKPRFSALALAVLLCLAATLSGLIQPKAAAGGADSVSAVAAETGQKVQEVTQAAESRLEEIWRRIDERRLKNRTRDELVAWIIIGLMVGGLIHWFSKVKQLTALLLGLAGAFLGGISANLAKLDLGMGPVLIRYEELLASLAGGILILLIARWLAARRTPRAGS